MKSIALFALLCALPASADRRAAERLIQEARAKSAAYEHDAAIAILSRAIEEAPDWDVPWTERGFAKAQAERVVSALEDLGVALRLKPGSVPIMNLRARVLMDLDRWQESADQSAAVLKENPGDMYALSLHGRALVQTGDVDGGIAELRRAGTSNPALSGDLPDALLIKGDWAGALEAAQAAIRANAPHAGPWVVRVVALVELGRYDEAHAAVLEAERAIPGTVGSASARAYLAGTPGSGRHHNPPEALRRIEEAASGTTTALILNQRARILFLGGDAGAALDLLATRGNRANFETLFWLGAAHWQLGKLAEARALLSDAMRRNPYLPLHARRTSGLAEFVASIDLELKGEAKDGVDRAKLGHELATHLLTVAEIEALVRRYEFARAADEYGRLLQALTSSVRRAEVEARLPEVRGMAGALRKLVGAINQGTLKLRPRIGATEIAIVKADERRFDFTLPRGEGRFPWACLDPAAFCDAARQAGAAAEELGGLGCLAWDAGLRGEAVKLFEDAVKKKSELRKLVDGFVARRRGISGGAFLVYKGAYVTAEEKANLEKGLVAFEGQWVTPKDREMMAKGLVKVGDKWVEGTEPELTARGYTKYEGKWMSREDYEALRSQWAHAWTAETAHYSIRTNESPAFAKDLAALIEAAWGEFAKFHGAEPKAGAERMTLYAFRTFEDYRKHCVETKSEEHLSAAGFARSDSNVVAGWNKTGNRQQFLQTMVHEAAHLYWFRVSPMARAPSWMSEGMATYFEGFSWDGKAYRFNHVSESRLPFVRDAMKSGRHMSFPDMFAADALALINTDTRKALLFYAQCWSLVFYLRETDRPEYRAAWADYRNSVAAGETKPLLEFFTDPVKLEADWIAFISGL
jgi:tetratricopeptide (TPR) repeat protein